MKIFIDGKEIKLIKTWSYCFTGDEMSWIEIDELGWPIKICITTA
jgi:hypothetical protein